MKQTSAILPVLLALLSPSAVLHGQSVVELEVGDRSVPTFQVHLDPGGGAPPGSLAGACPPVQSTLSNASFDGGSYILQAGFAEGEMAGASFTIDPDQFPVKIDLLEVLAGTNNATVTTTTEWTALFYEGTPRDGTLRYSFSSDGKLLPHLIVPPGNNIVNIQLLIDPGEPEQIILGNDGSDTFSVALRIDQHNSQTGNPCFVAPPSCCNAFPATDTGGLNFPGQNWLFAVDCILCPAGWSTFTELPSFCTPSGDWAIRATWTPFTCEDEGGACCLTGGLCVDSLSQVICLDSGGTWSADGTCAELDCDALEDGGPCCFESTGGCIQLPAADCTAAGGQPGPPGELCAGYTCFPIGAACLPDGSCIDGISPDTATSLGGIFAGDGTSCVDQDCPQPLGACCFATSFCLDLSQSECEQAGSSWGGVESNCVDLDGDSSANECPAVYAPGDINLDGLVNGVDITLLLSSWDTADPAADINGDGVVRGDDLTIVLLNWSP